MGAKARRPASRPRRPVNDTVAAVLRAVGDAVILADADGRIVDLNPVAARLTGWSAARARGTPLGRVCRLVDAATRRAVAIPVPRTLGARRAVHLPPSLLLMARDGTERAVAVTLTVLRAEGRKTPHGVVLAVRSDAVHPAEDDAPRASDDHVRMALAAAAQGCFDLDLRTGDVVVSPEHALMLGYDPADFRESRDAWTARLHPDDRERVLDAFEANVTGGQDEYRAEYRQRTADGRWKWILSLAKVVERDANGRAVRMVGTHTDITAEKETEAHLLRLSQLYAALGRCNQAIVRGRTAQEVFEQVCEAAVEAGGVQMAWIGLVEPGSPWVTPVAAYGEGTDYVRGIEISIDAADPRGQGPTGICIREGRPVWSAEFTRDPSLAPWRSRGEQFAWHASAALPLFRRGVVVGALQLYSTHADAFEAGARALLVDMGHDISFALDNFAREAERDRARRELEESQARLTKAQAISRMGFLDWDLRTNEIYWSDEVVRLFGLPPGRNWQTIDSTTALVHPDDRALVQEHLERAVRGELTYDIEHRMMRSDGGVVWVHAQAELSRDVDGNPMHLLGTVVDVTALKEVEAALRKSEERLRAIIDAEPECVKLVDRGGAIRDMNAAGLAMLEARSLAEVTQRPLLDYVLPPYRAAFTALHRKVMNGGSGRLEFEVEGLKGGRRWLETHGVPLRDENGAVTMLLGVTRDITERRRAEADLRVRSAALNAAADAVLIADPVGRIVWTNPAFTALTGYSPEDAAALDARALVTLGADAAEGPREMWDTVARGETWRGDLTCRRKDASVYPAELAITPVKAPDGSVTHVIAVIRDLTRQRQLEAQFLQSQRLETVGRLAGGIAHDFNNLITVINGTVQLMAMGRDERDPMADDFRAIREAGDRAASLVRQLLAFSRKQMMKPTIVDLNVQVDAAAPMLRRLLTEDVQLVLELDRQLHPVRADPAQIDQVLMNLAVNARDAMPDGGTLTIRTRNVPLESDAAGSIGPPPGPYVVLEIADTGVGMDEETRDRMFEPFFTTKMIGRGTGLGLSTVYGIVKQSGGMVTASSAIGYGTTVSVFLPRVDGAATLGSSARQPETRAMGTETILVVEDEPALRRVAARALSAAGYHVLTAGAADEALAVLTDHDGPVHVLLTDVVLPGMNGRELAARVTAMRPDIRVLYVSGHTDDAVLRRGVVEEHVAFLAKPFTVSELTQKLRDVLGEQEAV